MFATVCYVMMVMVMGGVIVQKLDQKIDKFINASENVCNNNNEAKPFIQNSIGDLKRYWNDIKRQSVDLRQSIDNTNRYFTVNEQVSNKSSFIQRASNDEKEGGGGWSNKTTLYLQ